MTTRLNSSSCPSLTFQIKDAFLNEPRSLHDYKLEPDGRLESEKEGLVVVKVVQGQQNSCQHLPGNLMVYCMTAMLRDGLSAHVRPGTSIKHFTLTAYLVATRW